MAAENFTVTEENGWKVLPTGCKGWTQNNHVRAYFAEATTLEELAGKNGEKILPESTYRVDSTKTYFIRAVGAAATFGLAME